MGDMTKIEKILKGKVLDLSKREQKIITLEDELKHKIQEVSRQLTVKEEEIISIKKRFKEEKVHLEQDKKRLTNQLTAAKDALEQTESEFRGFKHEVDESPLSVLRSEIAKQNVEKMDLEAKLTKSREDTEAIQSQLERVKADFLKLRKQTEKEKDKSFQRQAEEIEKLKMEMKSRQLAEQERAELASMKSQLSMMHSRLEQTKTQ